MAIGIGVRPSKETDRYHVPFLLVGRDDGSSSISREALAWACEMLGIGAAGVPTSRGGEVKDCISILARFVTFVGGAFGEAPLEIDEVDYALSAYCNVRFVGTDDPHVPGNLKVLGWKPAKATTIRREFGILVEFFEFCAARYGAIWPLTRQGSQPSLRAPISRLHDLQAAADRDFFHHLAARRAYWSEKRASRTVEFPTVVFRRARNSVPRQPPDRDEVEAIIKAERNPCFKGLWIAAAFGGLRISEQLNSWQVDHRPGADEDLFFGARKSRHLSYLPLYLRVHPSESTYIRHPQKKELSRRDFLHQVYATQPRNCLPRDHPLYAGWKGTVDYGLKLTHMVLWSDHLAARLFEQSVQEVGEFHRRHRTSLRHPWFFVNISERSGEYLGEPVKISRVQKAWDAAVRRVGLRPHEWGRSIHGLRHFYKQQLETELSMDSRSIQIAMGHASIRSQNEYNKEIRSLADSLEQALSVRGGQ